MNGIHVIYGYLGVSCGFVLGGGHWCGEGGVDYSSVMAIEKKRIKSIKLTLLHKGNVFLKSYKIVRYINSKYLASNSTI